MEDYHERLKLETSIGILHGLFHSCKEGGYVAWFEEKPMVIIEAESLTEACNELLISLDVILRYEREINLKNQFLNLHVRCH